MKIQYASDLHLEFPFNNAFVESHPITSNGEILILASDFNFRGDTDNERFTLRGKIIFQAND